MASAGPAHACTGPGVGGDASAPRFCPKEEPN
nr:MAG TPA: hypothetical protein [Caudoviricetes sp.]